MLYFASSSSAINVSWIFLEIVFSKVRKKFLDSCWVMVDPPSLKLIVVMFFTRARPIAR